MTPILPLCWRSLLNRKLTLGLTLISIALSVALLLGVERLRTQAHQGFATTIAGTDLILGARNGPIQLLLYSVFGIGQATNNLSWNSLQAIAAHPQVAWMVPLSLGDSHHGFRVLGTDQGYFQHYRYGRQRALAWQAGHSFSGLFELVLGAEVAAQLGYRLGDRIVLAHGAGEQNLIEHSDKPFRVVGILERTGTPVDRTLLVSLEAIEAIHIDWHSGAPPLPSQRLTPEQAAEFDLTPKKVTAALLGLKSRAAVFQVQRFINQYPGEPLLAILPGATLQELWTLIGVAEQAMLAISAFVVVVGLAGLTAVIIAGLGERRRELAILRSLGAGPRHIFFLLASESLVLSLAGSLLGLGLVYGLTLALAPLLESRLGLVLSLDWPSTREWGLLAAVIGGGFIASLFPAWRAYRLSLADGLTLRI